MRIRSGDYVWIWKRTLVDHAPIVGCFVCPVLSRGSTFREAVVLAEVVDVVLGAGEHCG